MKNSLLVFGLLLAFQSQTTAQLLSENNVSCLVGGNPGILFEYDQALSFPSYVVPNTVGIGAVFNTSLWCSAVDSIGDIHLAAMRYGQNGHDFFNGPYSSINSYSDPTYLSTYGQLFNTKGYEVTKADIDNHIANYTQPGYVTPNSILNWPANGNTSLGVSHHLAPYIDLLGDGVYNPLQGDYPDIRGDKAIFQIFNDAKGIHTESGGLVLGIEVHLMYYQYATNDYKNDATFVHARVFNRGNITYPNFKLGIWNDFLFGVTQERYVGCDTNTNLTYVYNADNFEGDSTYGFGANPPAFGLVSLNQELSHMGYFSNGASYPYNDPSAPANYHNLMNGSWNNGTPWTYGGNGMSGVIPTNYMFPGNPNDTNAWSQLSANTTPTYQKTISTFKDVYFPPQSYVCYDFAFLYARESGFNNLQNVDALISIAATAKTDFDAMTTYNCNQVTLGLEQLDETQISLYPNPTTGTFTLSFGNEAFSGEVIVSDMDGRTILQEEITNVNSKTIQLDANAGVYFISVKTSKGTVHKKMMLTK